MDDIWYVVGDWFIDMDWYIKCVLLGGVYVVIELYMFIDYFLGVVNILEMDI